MIFSKKHKCDLVKSGVMLAKRTNPLNSEWREWYLWGCKECHALFEGQIHSEECRMGTMLSITATATEEYARHMYKLEREQIEAIIKSGKSRYELA